MWRNGLQALMPYWYPIPWKGCHIEKEYRVLNKGGQDFKAILNNVRPSTTSPIL